ncbi:MAG: ATP-binding cassette domain-containing protein [Deltaproteobacteria bacterium]|nr:ATP-binding cassette domain-containing protein [Deltaproteobacteria bacterium]
MDSRSTPLLELQNVSRIFSRKKGFLGDRQEFYAVNGVSLALKPGETLGLVGESGSGKSTVARMAVRLLSPSAGRVLLDGRSMFTADKAFRQSLPRRVQMVFQDPYSSLNPRLRVGYSIGEALACAGVPARERKERVAALLAQVGLEKDYAARFPHEFSGGQRQRMALARALAPEPELVVCDEPVSSLDASVQAQVLNLLKDNQERLGLSYLFISHDLAVISHMSDRVAVMYAGRILETGSAADIFMNPLHPYTRELLEASRGRGNVGSGEPGKAVASGGSGCPYLRRCGQAGLDCAGEAPELREIRPGHFARCSLA